MPRFVILKPGRLAFAGRPGATLDRRRVRVHLTAAYRELTERDGCRAIGLTSQACAGTGTRASSRLHD